MSMKGTSELGFFAEHYAAEYLKSKGYTILGHNYRKPWGEIDIIAEKEGIVIHHQEGVMADPPDPFTRMNQSSTETPGEKARVSVTVQRSMAYGELKCSFTLSISCPQSKQWMDYAAEHVFVQAVKYVNDGMESLVPGVAPLFVPTPRIP